MRPRSGNPRILEDALRRTSLARHARAIFEACPNLERISARFAGYVTPHAVGEDGAPLLDRAYASAVAAYRGTSDPRAGIAAYIRALADTSEELARLRLSVQDSDGHWIIWAYDEPLSKLLNAHRREVVQTRVRPKPAPPGPIAIKLLAAICSTADLQVAGIGRETIANG